MFSGSTWNISQSRLSCRISRKAVNSGFSDIMESSTAHSAASRNTAASSTAKIMHICLRPAPQARRAPTSAEKRLRWFW